MSSSVLNKSHVVVSKCFEFFLQLLYQQSHSPIENSQEILFQIQSEGHVKVYSYQISNQHSDDVFKGRPAETMSKFVTSSQISHPLRLATQRN